MYIGSSYTDSKLICKSSFKILILLLNINYSGTSEPRQLQFDRLPSKEKLDNVKKAHNLRIQFSQSQCWFSQSNEKKELLRRQQIKPGSTAWKAAMLTTVPPTP